MGAAGGGWSWVIWQGHGTFPGGWLWPSAVVLALCAAGLGLWAWAAARRQRAGRGGAAGEAGEILRQRLARGEIGQAEYQQRLGLLESTVGRPRRTGWRGTMAVAAGAAVLAAVASATAAATTQQPAAPAAHPGPGVACRVPALAGHTVSVTLSDMGTMMGGGWAASGYPRGWMMGGNPPPMMARSAAGWTVPRRAGWMRMMAITVTPAVVSAGTVSFRVHNAGSITHELVVLPLPPSGAGARPLGPGGTVSELGSLGEASATCHAGAGSGITAGAAGWVSLHLAPGRYELICNRPGHYAMGMHAELRVR